MNYSKLVSVTGLSGLYELVSTKADGGIVRSLEDKSTKFVSNRIHNFSHLESIEVYTVKENTNLTDVFLAMKNSEEKTPDSKADAKVIKSYFEIVYPDLDFERVYASDMKKMLKWFSVINSNNIEIKASENEVKEAEVEHEKKSSSKPTGPKTAAVKNAPAKKINVPRKMA